MNHITNFDVRKCVSEGRDSFIFEIKYKFKNRIMKVFKKEAIKRRAYVIFNELYVLSNSTCPNIIKLIDVGTVDMANYKSIYLILEKYDMTLEKFIENTKYINPGIRKDIIEQIENGLRYLNNKLKRNHGDLSTANILIKNYRIVLSDFGQSKSHMHPNKNHMTSYQFKSPTNMFFPKHANNMGADYWSLGCIIFNMVTGKHLINSNNLMEYNEDIKNIKIKLKSHCFSLFEKSKLKKYLNFMDCKRVDKLENKQEFSKGISNNFFFILEYLNKLTKKQKIEYVSLLERYDNIFLNKEDKYLLALILFVGLSHEPIEWKNIAMNNFWFKVDYIVKHMISVKG